MQQRREPHRSAVDAVAHAADQRAKEKGRGDIAELLIGKSEIFGHVDIEYRAPDRVEAPQRQQGAHREKQLIAHTPIRAAPVSLKLAASR